MVSSTACFWAGVSAVTGAAVALAAAHSSVTAAAQTSSAERNFFVSFMFRPSTNKFSARLCAEPCV